LASCGQLPPQLKQRAVWSGVSDFGGNTALAVPGDSMLVACYSETSNVLASANRASSVMVESLSALSLSEDAAKCTTELFEI